MVRSIFNSEAGARHEACSNAIFPAGVAIFQPGAGSRVVKFNQENLALAVGVILASVKELDFAWSALFTACLANLFAAFKVGVANVWVVRL